MSGFSNYGTCVDIFAPGVGVKSALNCAGCTASWSGTSMACPHVSGAAAALRAANPDMTALAISTALVCLATDGAIGGLNSNTPNKFLLAGAGAAADAKASATPWGQMAKGNVDVKCVSTAEAETLRREIQTQDAIMRGYQKENEAAIDTIASMKREFTVKEGDFVGQIERLNGEIARLRLESERTGGDSSRQIGRAHV